MRVAEITVVWAGPHVTQLFAEWGADVVKIEHPVRGDAYRGLRHSGPLAVEHAFNYAIEHANRGKRSLGLDVSVPEGRALLLELVEAVRHQLEPKAHFHGSFTSWGLGFAIDWYGAE